MPVYRYKFSGVDINKVKNQVPPADASSISSGYIASLVVWDVTAPSTSKDDLDNYMETLGWVFVETDPSNTPQEAADSEIVINNTTINGNLDLEGYNIINVNLVDGYDLPDIFQTITNQDAYLQSELTNLNSDSINQDAYLQSELTNLNSDSISQDAYLQGEISSIYIDYISADAYLQSEITNLNSDSISQDAYLQSELTNLNSDSISQDAYLQSEITNLNFDSISQDAYLQSELTNLNSDSISQDAYLQSEITNLNSDFLLHAPRHQNGGDDEINVAGLNGVLADRQDAYQIMGVNVDDSGIADGYILAYNSGSGNIEYVVSGSGSGDISGPGSSTDNAAARWDGTTGKILQNSSFIISDDGRIATMGDPIQTDTAANIRSIAQSPYGINVGSTTSYDNVDIEDYGMAQFHSANQNFEVTGFSQVDHGKFMWVTNLSDYDLTLKHEDLGSTSTQRLALPNDSDLIIKSGSGVALSYTTTSSRWQCASIPGSLPLHASTHQSGGDDAIKLDDLASPDDNTDLNSTTSYHGLLPKLGGGIINYLRADGTWAEPPGGSGSSRALFFAYDAAGGIDIPDSPSWVDITLDTEVREDSAFTHTTDSAVVEINTDGWYEITYYMSFEVTGGNDGHALARLVLDTGGGYNEIGGSRIRSGVSKNDLSGGGSATILAELNDGDKIKIQATEFNDKDFITTANACGLVIRDAEASGATGPAGPGGGQTLYDAIVAPSGGDYTLPSAAFTSGAKSVFVRTGTYVETANIVVPDGGLLLGEDDCIIDLSNGYSVTIDGNGGTTEESGTISITSGTSAVVGSGTTFTNLSPGDFIAIGGTFYQIASITDNTHLTVAGTYEGLTISGQAMLGTSAVTSANIDNITLSGATGNALLVRGAISCIFRRMEIQGCNVGVVVEDSGSAAFSDIGVVQCGVGITYSNCRSVSFSGLVSGNVGNGIVVGSGCNTVAISSTNACNNGSNGILVQSGAVSTLISHCVLNYNDAEGIETAIGSNSTIISSCVSSNNGGVGIDTDGEEDVISMCTIENNVGEGIWTGEDSLVTSCHIASNGGSGIECTVDTNSLISNNHIHGNGSHGIYVTADANSTNILIASNRILNNTGDGIRIASGANTNNCYLADNLVTGHTTNINNGNSTTVRSVQAAGNPVQGDILYHNGTNWVRLGYGTSGYYLKTNGVGSNPSWAAVSGGSSIVPHKIFQADQLESPVSSDWAVNSLAPLIPDANNTALSVRAFDDTTVEGVGFTIRVPTGATNIILGFLSRRATAATTANVGLNLYKRAIPDNAVIPAWGSPTLLTNLSMPNNVYYQKDSQTIAISTLGLTVGVTYLFELCRNVPTDTLPGDWLLHSITIGWS